MDIKASFAAQTYVRARDAMAPLPQQAEHGSTGFTRLVEDFAAVLAQGEATARAAMTGSADPHALVQALAASEMAVETAVTVRDKVVEAYQEIMRMPV